MSARFLEKGVRHPEQYTRLGGTFIDNGRMVLVVNCEVRSYVDR